MTVRELFRTVRLLFNEENGEKYFTLKMLSDAVFEKNGIGKDERIIFPNKLIADTVSEKVINDAKALLRGYPFQYYTGIAEFCGYEFMTDENVLIPRPDTETLVFEALKREVRGTVFDLCCGTGCVGIAMLKKCPGIKIVSCDISESAVSCAGKNAEKLGVSERIRVFRGDIMTPFLDELIEKYPPSLIVSNPPYIPTDDIRSLERNVKNEPFIALDGGDDGTVFYRRLFSVAEKYGIPFDFEIGFDLGEKIKSEAKKTGLSVRITKDAQGNDRCVSSV